MVTAEDSPPREQHSVWNTTDLDHMIAVVESKKQNNLPFFLNSSRFAPNVDNCGHLVSDIPNLATALADGFQGSFQPLPCLPNSCILTTNADIRRPPASAVPAEKMVQTNGKDGSFQLLLPDLVSLSPTRTPYLKSQHETSYGLGVHTAPVKAFNSAEKRFLVFDQSGDHTRLFYSQFSSPFKDQCTITKRPANVCDFGYDKMAPVIEQMHQREPVKEENLKDPIIGEGSEMHEDTEEINALLYSDDYYVDDDDDDDSEDDEITSTGHSPFVLNQCYSEHERSEELVEDDASSNGTNKRRRLYDCGYKKSSWEDTANSLKLAKSCNYTDDVDSSCAWGGGNGTHTTLSSVQRKAKIRETLRMLKRIIPGFKSDDPFLIIDEAVNYLKSLRLEAEALGVSYP